MTQKEKSLLLQDLCARLPYGVNVEIDGYNISVLKGIDGDTISTDRGINYPPRVVKPYLRPMSSMTEEEKSELKEYLDAEEVDCNGFGCSEGGTLEDYISSIPYSVCGSVVDWLVAHHFDYRGLIPMGLALPAKEGMYKI